MTNPIVSTRRVSNKCLSDLELDKHLDSEEFGKSASSDHDSHIHHCGPCQERLDTLRENIRSFPEEVFLQALVTRSAASPAQTNRKKHNWFSLGAFFAVSFAGILFFIHQSRQTEEGQGIATERTKGELNFQIVVRHHDARVEPILPGQKLRANESIRFAVTPKETGFLAIIGVDSAKVVSPYMPTNGLLTAVTGGEEHWVEGSIILDETLGPERVYALLCEQPFPIDEIVAAANTELTRVKYLPQQMRRLETDCKQSSLWFEKVP